MDQKLFELCKSVRGFNYQPGYAANLQIIWTQFDRDRCAREIAWSKRFGTNALRIWLDWHAWIALEEKILDRFDEMLSICGANGIKCMPVLFNRWNDKNWPMGFVSERDLTNSDLDFRKFKPYVMAMMERFGGDGRILCWDLCNEPQAPYREPETNFREALWLSHVNSWVRSASGLPVTIGTMIDDNLRAYAPLVDIISFHPYAEAPGKMEEMIRAAQTISSAYGKPLLCTEACKGSFDDEKRGAQAKEDIETLERHGVGWLVWQLMEGDFITGNKRKTDNNALDHMQGYMPFILSDGRTRPGHGWLESPGKRNSP